MGHNSPETTLRYYARWIPDTKSRWFGTKSGTNDDERSSQVVGLHGAGESSPFSFITTGRDPNDITNAAGQNRF